MKRKGRGERGEGREEGKANTPAPAMKAVALLQHVHDASRNLNSAGTSMTDGHGVEPWQVPNSCQAYTCPSPWLSLAKAITWQAAFKLCIPASEGIAGATSQFVILIARPRQHAHGRWCDGELCNGRAGRGQRPITTNSGPMCHMLFCRIVTTKPPN